MKQRLTALLLCAALCLALAPGALAAGAGEAFADVAEDGWYAPAVAWCAARGLMGGVGGGRFAPDGLVTRGQAVTVLYRFTGAPEVSAETGFSDVLPDMWYTPAVAWAARSGVATGYEYGVFGVDDPITREQLAAMLWRYCGSPAAAADDNFADAAEIAAYAVPAVRWARAAGVLSGKPGNLFDPRATATRAQLAQILMNLSASGAANLAARYLSEMDVAGAPCGIARTDGGILLITDTLNMVVWQVKDGVSSVYTGARGQSGYRDGTLDDSLFASPWAIAPFLDGWAVSDPENNAVRLVRLSGTETVNAETKEDLPRTGLGVAFEHPTGLAADTEGNLYVSDTFRGAIRRIDSGGTLVTVAEGLDDPMGLCWADGALYVAETGANRIVRIVNGRTETVAGSGAEGDADGSAAEAEFSAPQGVTVAPDGTVYVADTGNGAVRRIRNGRVTTVLAPAEDVLDSVPVSPIGLLVHGNTLYVCDNFLHKLLAVPLGG